MNMRDEILINKYAQGLEDLNALVTGFKLLVRADKYIFLEDIVYLIMQSKAMNCDIDQAIKSSNLKPTYTPCVMLKKGVDNYILYKIINLPDNELEKVFVLLLSLFKISYNRRFNEEKNNPDKWWYWDLSDEDNILKIVNKYSF